MQITDFFLLEDFDELIRHFPSREGSNRDLLLKALRHYYKTDDDLNRKKTTPDLRLKNPRKTKKTTSNRQPTLTQTKNMKRS